MRIELERKRAEAVRRMRALGMYGEIIEQFKRGQLNRSEPPFGACYWVEGADLAKVRAFEAKYNALVYHVIHTPTTIGAMDSYLYVSDHEEEWGDDYQWLLDGETLAYVIGIEDEFGSIGVKLSAAGGLERTW